MIKVDKELEDCFEQAMQILEDNKADLLKYNDTTSIKKAMYPIKEVVVNRRAQCRRGCMKHLPGGEVKIEISSYILTFEEKEALTTMVHELLHCFRDSRGHKGEWLYRARLLSKKTGLRIQRTRQIEEEYNLKQINEAPANFKFRCSKCHYIIMRKKQSKFTRNPQRYIHTGCGGHFERMSDIAWPI